MIGRFRSVYALRRDSAQAGEGWLPAQLMSVDGYSDFASEFGGASFDGGLYRIHDSRTGTTALGLIADAFPEFAKRSCPFGYDWLGRQFAIDSDRVVAGQPQVLLFEPGTGEVLEVPCSFSTFHEFELVESPDAALAADFFKAWSNANPHAMPLLRDQCVGYQRPLFLGGQDLVENLELSDIEVYWSLCGQLRRLAPQIPMDPNSDT